MADEVRFAADVYRGSAGYYDRYRLPYPEAMLAPDLLVLSDAGFEVAGRHEFAVGHRWSLSELAGLIRSTSFLPAAVLGDQGPAFDADLAAALGPVRRQRCLLRDRELQLRASPQACLRPYAS